jgi:hypothetical protein
MLFVIILSLTVAYYFVYFGLGRARRSPTSIAAIVSEGDSAFKKEEYQKAIEFYLEAGSRFWALLILAAKHYKEDFLSRTVQAVAGRKHSYDWRNSEVPFLGSHTFNQLGYLYLHGLGVECDREVWKMRQGLGCRRHLSTIYSPKRTPLLLIRNSHLERCF